MAALFARLLPALPPPDPLAKLLRHRVREPPNGGVLGTVVVAATFTVFAVVIGLEAVYGILMAGMLEEDPRWTRSGLSWAQSIATFLELALGVVVGSLVERFTARATCLAGGGLLALGLLLASSAQSEGAFMLWYSLVGGTGMALCYGAASIAVGMYFTTRAAFANAAAGVGIGVGTIVLAQVIEKTIVELGWRSCMRLLAAITAVAVSASALCYVPIEEEGHGGGEGTLVLAPAVTGMAGTDALAQAETTDGDGAGGGTLTLSVVLEGGEGSATHHHHDSPGTTGQSLAMRAAALAAGGGALEGSTSPLTALKVLRGGGSTEESGHAGPVSRRPAMSSPRPDFAPSSPSPLRGLGGGGALSLHDMSHVNLQELGPGTPSRGGAQGHSVTGSSSTPGSAGGTPSFGPVTLHIPPGPGGGRPPLSIHASRTRAGTGQPSSPWAGPMSPIVHTLSLPPGGVQGSDAIRTLHSTAIRDSPSLRAYRGAAGSAMLSGSIRAHEGASPVLRGVGGPVGGSASPLPPPPGGTGFAVGVTGGPPLHSTRPARHASHLPRLTRLGLGLSTPPISPWLLPGGQGSASSIVPHMSLRHSALASLVRALESQQHAETRAEEEGGEGWVGRSGAHHQGKSHTGRERLDSNEGEGSASSTPPLTTLGGAGPTGQPPTVHVSSGDEGGDEGAPSVAGPGCGAFARLLVALRLLPTGPDGRPRASPATRVWLDGRFWAIATCMALIISTMTVPESHLATYVTSDLGMGTEEAGRLYSVMGVAGILGRLGFGFLTLFYRVDLQFLLQACGVATGLSMCGLAVFGTSAAYRTLFAIVFGGVGGSTYGFVSPILADYFGLSGLPFALGGTYTVRAPTVLLFSPLAGLLREATGTYDAVFFICGVLCVVSALPIGVLHCECSKHDLHAAVKEAASAETRVLKAVAAENGRGKGAGEDGGARAVDMSAVGGASSTSATDGRKIV